MVAFVVSSIFARARACSFHHGHDICNSEAGILKNKGDRVICSSRASLFCGVSADRRSAVLCNRIDREDDGRLVLCGHSEEVGKKKNKEVKKSDSSGNGARDRGRSGGRRSRDRNTDRVMRVNEQGGSSGRNVRKSKDRRVGNGNKRKRNVSGSEKFSKIEDDEDYEDDQDDEINMEGFGALPNPFERSEQPSDEEEEPFFITEEKTGRHLACGIEASITWKNAEYMACYPFDHAVLVGRKDVKGKLHPVDHGGMDDAFFGAAKKAVLDVGWILARTGFFWTMEEGVETERVGTFKLSETFGQFDDEIPDDEDLPPGSEESYFQKEIAEIDEMKDDREGEDAQEICTFKYHGDEYSVVYPFEPILLLAKRYRDKITIPTEAEARAVTPLLEKEIEKSSKLKDAYKNMEL